ncbi:MAG TPA: hypothetical protein VF516_06565 [Kofleriaceae bacterium]
MIDLQRKVNRTVQGFVAQVIELVRHTALETLQTAFTDSAATSPAAARSDRGPAAGSPGRRRTPDDLDALARRLAMVVRTHPGLRIAELAERLGTRRRALSVPIRKLIAEGVIEARGRRRATTYVAAAAPEAPDAEPKAAAPVPVGPAPPVAPSAGFDADWYRCLTGVYMLAHKLQK